MSGPLPILSGIQKAVGITLAGAGAGVFRPEAQAADALNQMVQEQVIPHLYLGGKGTPDAVMDWVKHAITLGTTGTTPEVELYRQGQGLTHGQALSKSLENYFANNSMRRGAAGLDSQAGVLTSAERKLFDNPWLAQLGHWLAQEDGKPQFLNTIGNRLVDVKELNELENKAKAQMTKILQRQQLPGEFGVFDKNVVNTYRKMINSGASADQLEAYIMPHWNKARSNMFSSDFNTLKTLGLSDDDSKKVLEKLTPEIMEQILPAPIANRMTRMEMLQTVAASGTDNPVFKQIFKDVRFDSKLLDPNENELGQWKGLLEDHGKHLATRKSLFLHRLMETKLDENVGAISNKSIERIGALKRAIYTNDRRGVENSSPYLSPKTMHLPMQDPQTGQIIGVPATSSEMIRLQQSLNIGNLHPKDWGAIEGNGGVVKSFMEGRNLMGIYNYDAHAQKPFNQALNELHDVQFETKFMDGLLGDGKERVSLESRIREYQKDSWNNPHYQDTLDHVVASTDIKSKKEFVDKVLGEYGFTPLLYAASEKYGTRTDMSDITGSLAKATLKAMEDVYFPGNYKPLTALMQSIDGNNGIRDTISMIFKKGGLSELLGGKQPNTGTTADDMMATLGTSDGLKTLTGRDSHESERKARLQKIWSEVNDTRFGWAYKIGDSLSLNGSSEKINRVGRDLSAISQAYLMQEAKLRQKDMANVGGPYNSFIQDIVKQHAAAESPDFKPLPLNEIFQDIDTITTARRDMAKGLDPTARDNAAINMALGGNSLKLDDTFQPQTIETINRINETLGNKLSNMSNEEIRNHVSKRTPKEIKDFLLYSMPYEDAIRVASDPTSGKVGVLVREYLERFEDMSPFPTGAPSWGKDNLKLLPYTEVPGYTTPSLTFKQASVDLAAKVAAEGENFKPEKMNLAELNSLVQQFGMENLRQLASRAALPGYKNGDAVNIAALMKIKPEDRTLEQVAAQLLFHQDQLTLASQGRSNLSRLYV